MLGGGKGEKGGSGSTIVIGWRRIPPFFSLSQEKKVARQNLAIKTMDFVILDSVVHWQLL
jgi:hypothetical protein